MVPCDDRSLSRPASPPLLLPVLIPLYGPPIRPSTPDATDADGPAGQWTITARNDRQHPLAKLVHRSRRPFSSTVMNPRHGLMLPNAPNAAGGPVGQYTITARNGGQHPLVKTRPPISSPVLVNRHEPPTRPTTPDATKATEAAGPAGQWKLAGGVSHRTTTPPYHAP